MFFLLFVFSHGYMNKCIHTIRLFDKGVVAQCAIHCCRVYCYNASIISGTFYHRPCKDANCFVSNLFDITWFNYCLLCNNIVKSWCM